MNDLFKKVYLDLIMQSTIKDDYIDYFFKKENIKGENKKDPKQLERAKKFIDDIFSELNLNNPSDSFRAKKQKALLYWLRNGTITIPIKEEQKQTLEKAFNLLSKHASLNFQNFNSPIDMLNSSDKSVRKINAEYKFNPETEPKFFNKKDLGDGIVIYQVEDSKEGQAAVRKVIDSDWGYDKNPWCLAARKGGSLDDAWSYWEKYNKIPKRIAFKNGKLHAFSATSNLHTCQWWDRNDNFSESIPHTTVSDDLEFLIQFCPLTYVKNNPNSPLTPDILKKLSKDKKYDVRAQVAENPNCPLDILKKLSEDKKYDVRASVARNPKCPPDILKKLSEDEDYDVRAVAAKNPKCPPDVLKKLSEDEDLSLKGGVAKNPKCPPDILKKLSEDESSFVRETVTKNPNCSLDILKKLSEDESSFVRRGVTKNPNCSLDILKKLSEDKKYDVRAQVADTPNCPIDILKKLSEDKDQAVRRGVAKNTKCPSDILRKLSEDKDKYVRTAVTENPNCPLDILEKLANPESEKSESVRDHAKKTLQSLKNLKNKNRTQDNNILL